MGHAVVTTCHDQRCLGVERAPESIRFGIALCYPSSRYRHLRSCHRWPSPWRRGHTGRVSATTQHQDVGIFGAGAAGLTAAYFSASQGARVCLYEKTNESGKKIQISGGTRCNILPGNVVLEEDFFCDAKPGCVRSIFGQWSLEECRHWLENEIGIEMTVEKETNKVFPVSNSGAEVRDRLLQSCLDTNNVTLQYSHDLESITWDEASCMWLCRFSGSNDTVSHSRVIMATGGKSFPNLGTTGTGYAILESLGHTVSSTYPALTPLKGILPASEELSGVSLTSVDLSVKPTLGDAALDNAPKGTATANKKKKKKKIKALHSKRHGFLFTHRGFSGPSVLDLSHVYTMAASRGQRNLPDFRVAWDLELTSSRLQDALSDPGQFGLTGKSHVTSLLRRSNIPLRLCKALCKESGIPDDRIIAELKKEERIKLLTNVTEYPLQVTGDEGYPKAEVTGGGVPLSELNCTTMESTIMPNLFICGELCDIHGRIGGFNFLFAWNSGRLAGIHAALSLQK